MFICTDVLFCKVNILHYSPSGAMSWKYDQNSVDNAQCFSCCWTVFTQRQGFLGFSLCPSQQVALCEKPWTVVI